LRAVAIKSIEQPDRLEAFETVTAINQGRHTAISKRRALSLLFPALFIIDGSLVSGSFLGARWLAPDAYGQYSLFEAGLALFSMMVVMGGGFLFLGSLFDLFEPRGLSYPRQLAGRTVRAAFWSGLVAVMFTLLLAMDPPSGLRRFFMIHSGLLAIAVTCIRPLAFRLVLRLTEIAASRPKRILVIGVSPEARRAAAAMTGDGTNEIEIAGLVELGDFQDSPGQRWPRFHVKSWNEVPRLAFGLAVEEVVLATSRIARGAAVELAATLGEKGIETNVIPHLTQLYVVAAPTRRDNSVPLLMLQSLAANRLAKRFKRTFDVLCTVLIGLLFLPLIAVIAVCVWLTSPGPILYGQTRVGENGRHFRMYKFRSMNVANDDSGHRQYVESLFKQGDPAGIDPSGRPVYKILDDPRVTLVGKVLRHTSLDELPQLINVLRGDMSLVGPRPCLPFEFNLYDSWQRRRVDCTPGMTGLWQVSGRSLLSFEEMVLLDLYYLANWSLMLDLKLMWRTIPEVLYTRGAR
jgi:exopolysaccharide biosynthesis polyprenyl glycosylphosphotransferase